ncbi:GNAT family N-acetyltransferase [Solirubrobacter phytolaccae]|uniref:GNAT family N-acetyltransferase n=1 Tax=Solirubrobacter phytolaccae TaxID=1404360 RepID=A0A9X3NBS4_9ACTN|nr:GNAT family N-acetyltransferase [Solirubrobacter phytolaccae]MDA0181852.1 GNAT family N-acetyltransferase [Solirubrobacter phytolaccae]
MTVRPARTGDGAALARVHADLAAHYAELDPERFRVPDMDGFAAWQDAELADAGGDELDLVLEHEGEVVGSLYARLIRPPDGARWASPVDVTRPRLSIEYLAVLREHRRAGLGTALVEAAEAWGRERGAVVAETTTYHRGPVSVPFWTERAGYEPRSINFRKPL